ncbi:hypothetical protein Ahy_B01g053562 [Arachis hypogaea]|uniref:Nudix hydrolase domain-containing protein n=1 Tax=Arachis hypogaea TaxID=3818 RepID=A0A445AS63_ARAHY|nr:hypothetical protein Ahy_B01g053562 [Arachis hypogaea]
MGDGKVNLPDNLFSSKPFDSKGHLSKILLRATTRPCFTVHPPSATAATPAPPLGRHRVAPAIHSSSSIFPFPSPVPIPCFSGELAIFKKQSNWFHRCLLRQMLWSEAHMVRKAMRDTGVEKMPGVSFIEVNNKAKVPTGRIILELPAGMLDDDKGDFVGNAVREVEEEIGIKLKLEDMVDLTTFLDSSTGCGFFPSPASIGMDNLNA